MSGELPSAWKQMVTDLGQVMALVDLIERKKIIDARMTQEWEQ